jgi:hypothetical protein
MATEPGVGRAVIEVRIIKPNGEKWHHASMYIPQFEATATFRAIIKKIKPASSGSPLRTARSRWGALLRTCKPCSIAAIRCHRFAAGSRRVTAARGRERHVPVIPSRVSTPKSPSRCHRRLGRGAGQCRRHVRARRILQGE